MVLVDLADDAIRAPRMRAVPGAVTSADDFPGPDFGDVRIDRRPGLASGAEDVDEAANEPRPVRREDDRTPIQGVHLTRTNDAPVGAGA